MFEIIIYILLILSLIYGFYFLIMASGLLGYKVIVTHPKRNVKLIIIKKIILLF